MSINPIARFDTDARIPRVMKPAKMCEAPDATSRIPVASSIHAMKSIHIRSPYDER